MRLLWCSQLFVPALLYLDLVTTIVGLPHVPSTPDFSAPELTSELNDPTNLSIDQEYKLLPRGGITFHHAFDIGNDWNMYYSSWPAALLPVQPAAWALVNLYMSIKLQTKSTWSKGPPQHSFTATFGKIQISMLCLQRPIPWLFVENFAEKLLMITKGGWTGVYSVMLSQAVNDITIVVELMVVS